MVNYEILLVDDDPFILQSIGPALVKKGYQVTTAENGQKGIDALNKSSFDLVLTDLMMEDVDGFQILKEVKELKKETMVIVLTGYSDVTLAIDCLRLGADDYVLKPCKLEELLFRLNSCFEKLEDKRKIRQTERALRLSEETFRAIYEYAPIMIDSFDENGRCIMWNKECEKQLGPSFEEMKLQKDPLSMFYPDPEIKDKVLKALQKRDGHFREYRVFTNNGTYRDQLWADFEIPNGHSISIGLDITERKQSEQELQKAHEELETKVKIRTTELEQEITKRKQAEEQIKVSLKEKEVLLKEIHHRVKNNLQIISSLIKLQAHNIDDKAVKATLFETQNRVHTMTTVHEMLYGSKSLSDIDLNRYLSKLSKNLHHSYSVNPDQVKLAIDCDEIVLDIEKASSLGLIVNELISNSLKYGFPDGRNGEINLNVKKQDSDFELTVKDNGIGFPKDFDLENTTTLGLKLVKILTENEFGGSIQLKQEQDTCFVIRIKL